MCLAASALVSAADFWTSRPFLDWSDKEARAIAADSPWAAVVSVALPPRGPVPSADVTGGGRGGGGRGDEGFGPAPLRIRVTISWRSALPVKQAAIRSQVGRGGTLSADQQAFLAQDEQFYVIGIEGLPPQYSSPGAGTSVESFLRPTGKPPIPAARAGAQPARGGGALLIAFPRNEPIAVEDGDVEFTAKFGSMEIKKKFKLKDMLFDGSLAL